MNYLLLQDVSSWKPPGFQQVFSEQTFAVLVG